MKGYLIASTMIVTSLLIMLVTGIISMISGDDDMGVGWLLSSFGFGICLTIVLLEKGII